MKSTVSYNIISVLCSCLPPVTFINPSSGCFVFMSHSMFVFLWCLPGWRQWSWWLSVTQPPLAGLPPEAGRQGGGGQEVVWGWEGMEGEGGGRKDVASVLQQEGEEVSCRNSEVELWVWLDQWQISQNSPTRSISTTLSRVCDTERRSLGSHRKPQIL